MKCGQKVWNIGIAARILFYVEAKKNSAYSFCLQLHVPVKRLLRRGTSLTMLLLEPHTGRKSPSAPFTGRSDLRHDQKHYLTCNSASIILRDIHVYLLMKDRAERHATAEGREQHRDKRRQKWGKYLSELLRCGDLPTMHLSDELIKDAMKGHALHTHHCAGISRMSVAALWVAVVTACCAVLPQHDCPAGGRGPTSRGSTLPIHEFCIMRSPSRFSSSFHHHPSFHIICCSVL